MSSSNNDSNNSSKIALVLVEGVISKQWKDIQTIFLEHKGSRVHPRNWAKNIIQGNWKLLKATWTERNDKLHNTQMILDNEGHKELMAAVKKEWAIGLGRLPIRDFAHLFQIKKDKFYSRTVEYIKTWFVTVRLGREIHNDPNLIIDNFSTPGPLQHWVGLTNSKIEHKELTLAISKEWKIGPSQLITDTQLSWFQHNLDEILAWSTDKQKEWFRKVRQARETTEDNKSIIDRFSVSGPLRKWVGLN